MVHVLVVRDMSPQQRAEFNEWIADPTGAPESGGAWDTAGDIVRVP